MTIAVILGSWFLVSVVTGLLIGRILHGAWWQEGEGQGGLPVCLRMSRAEFEHAISIASARWRAATPSPWEC